MKGLSRLLKAIGGLAIISGLVAALQRARRRTSPRPKTGEVQRDGVRRTIAQEDGPTALSQAPELPAGAGYPAMGSYERGYGVMDSGSATEAPAGDYLAADGPTVTEFEDDDDDGGDGEAVGADREIRARYANVVLTDPGSGIRYGVPPPVEPGQRLGLLLDIGPPRVDSAVYNPEPFPSDLLPRDDLVIDVVVSSPHFNVAFKGEEATHGTAQSAQMILPADGTPARTTNGENALEFVLTAPSEPQLARARITYFYADAPVQSHLIEAEVASGQPIKVGTDFTITSAPRDLEVLTKRPRVSLLVNGDEASHQVLVRLPSASAGELPKPTTFEMPSAVAKTVRGLRANLAGDDVAPTSVRLSRAQLTKTLRRTAPLGWELFSVFLGIIRKDLLQLLAPDTVLTVVRPAGSGLSVPWAWLYSIAIDSKYERNDYAHVPVCQLVANWDEASPLVDEDARQCPYAGEPSHKENILCPFGFLGFQHEIEQLTTTKDPVVSISLQANSPAMVVGETQAVDQATLAAHVDALKSILGGRGPSYRLVEGPDKDAIRRLVTTDLPLLYFYCHGERPSGSSAETYLGVGSGEWIAAKDFNGWVLEAFRDDHKVVWDRVRPLVFVNACHSAELDPEALFNYVDAFVGAGNAAGVVGTEVRVFSPLAMQFAVSFYTALFQPGVSVGEALRRGRMEFLSAGNLFGLLYTPYCWADLKIEAPAASKPGSIGQP